MLKWSAFSTVGRHSSHSVQGTRLCVRHRWASSICRSYAVPHGLFDLSLCTAQNCQEQLHNFFSPLRIVIAGAVLDCLRAARAVLERETRATNGNTRGKECQTRFVAVCGINRRDPATNSEQNATHPHTCAFTSPKKCGRCKVVKLTKKQQAIKSSYTSYLNRLTWRKKTGEGKKKKI